MSKMGATTHVMNIFDKKNEQTIGSSMLPNCSKQVSIQLMDHAGYQKKMADMEFTRSSYSVYPLLHFAKIIG